MKGRVLGILFITAFAVCGYVLPCMAQDTVELLVVLEQGASIEPLPQGVITSCRIPGSPVIRMRVSKDRVEEIMRELKARKDVRSVERSGTGRIENNPDVGGLKDSEWYEEIEGKDISKLSSGAGVLVAVIDTGIDLENTIFEPCVFVNPAEIPGDLIDNDGNGYIDDRRGWDFGDNDNEPRDENGHGTEVSSIILGLAPECRILPLKINPDGGDTFTTGDLVECIYYALSLGARVINLSLTVDQNSEAVSEAIRAAYGAGSLVVAAAGNDSGDVAFPASMDEVIAVGSLYGDMPAWFSPEGPELEITAPGVAVEVIGPGGTMMWASGTSLSCAMVSGTAAVLRGMNPHLKNETARLLLSSGTRDLGDPGRDPVYGEGALDGDALWKISVPDLSVPPRPFYAFPRSNPIEVAFHLPPTDSAGFVYIGLLGPDTLWWLDGMGNWHDWEIHALSPVTSLIPLNVAADGVLFGEGEVFPALDLSQWPSGLYRLAIALTDEQGRLLGPVTWDYMLLFGK